MRLAELFVLGLTLAFRVGHFLEFLLAHRFFHLLRRTFEFRLWRIAALGAERGPGSLLLRGRLGGHGMGSWKDADQQHYKPEMVAWLKQVLALN